MLCNPEIQRQQELLLIQGKRHSEEHRSRLFISLSNGPDAVLTESR